MAEKVSAARYPLSFNGFNASPYLGNAPDLPGLIEAAASAGFPLIGLDRFSLEAYLQGGGTRAQARQLLDSAHIACSAITAVAMLGLDPAADQALADARNWAEDLGAPFIQVNMGCGGADQRTVLDKACRIVDGAARLAIEYMPICPLDRAGDTLALVDTVGRDRAGLMIDIWHHENGPDDWIDLAAIPADAIAYVEFNDAPPVHGDPGIATIDQRSFPGEGHFDLDRFAATIRATGYQGPVSIEVLSKPWRGGDLKAFARRCRESSAPYWA